MTKVEAIEAVIRENGGCASLQIIYDKIEQFYPSAKHSKSWDAGLRGVLYRELKEGNKFKKVGLSLYALNDYVEETKPRKGDIRMHSYIEGLCVELGNSHGFLTYTADPSAKYRDNVFLKDIVSMDVLPSFTYNEIVNDVRRIDVLWFEKKKYSFPLYAFEVVDSIGTLTGALARCFQLKNFRTQFFVVAPEIHRAKFEQTIAQEVYSECKEYFKFVDYNTITATYDNVVGGYKLRKWLV